MGNKLRKLKEMGVGGGTNEENKENTDTQNQQQSEQQAESERTVDVKDINGELEEEVKCHVG